MTAPARLPATQPVPSSAPADPQPPGEESAQGAGPAPSSRVAQWGRLGHDVSFSLLRKAAIVVGGPTDYAGQVSVVPMKDFDMGKTIFAGVKGALPRLVLKARLAVEAVFDGARAAGIESDYSAHTSARPAPTVDPKITDFLVKECDFSMEHADGSFLQHLFFCHDYSAEHFPEYSPNVALLHSILGTATNLFPMDVEKLPKLQALLSDFEAKQVDAFPSMLRLFYDGKLLPELRDNLHRLGQLESIRFHRVIDNKPIELSAEDFWISLNYHLMHFVDFAPAANWSSHADDPMLSQFREVSEFLDLTGNRLARVDVEFPDKKTRRVGETRTLARLVSDLIPGRVKAHLTRKQVRDYSAEIGHSLAYELKWRD
ncbi:MAG: hypothetical protein AAFQ82_23450 [Myxococcota bacterium]